MMIVILQQTMAILLGMCFWREGLEAAISQVGDDGKSDAKKKYLVFLRVARTLKAES